MGHMQLLLALTHQAVLACKVAGRTLSSALERLPYKSDKKVKCFCLSLVGKNFLHLTSSTPNTQAKTGQYSRLEVEKLT